MPGIYLSHSPYPASFSYFPQALALEETQGKIDNYTTHLNFAASLCNAGEAARALTQLEAAQKKFDELPAELQQADADAMQTFSDLRAALGVEPVEQ